MVEKTIGFIFTAYALAFTAAGSFKPDLNFWFYLCSIVPAYIIGCYFLFLVPEED